MRRKRGILHTHKFKTFIACGIMSLVLIIGFATTYDLRVWLAGTLLTTQHGHWAKYMLVGENKINELRSEISHPKIVNSTQLPKSANINNESDQVRIDGQEKKEKENQPLVQVIPVERKKSATRYFKGNVMVIKDPSRVHLVPTVVKKSKGRLRGEWITEYAERTHAIGAINASGFSDPNEMSWADKAAGLVIVNGKVLQDYNHKAGDTALGITYNGKLITGSYSSKELIAMGVRDAMSFRPQLIVNGKNMFETRDSASWGVQPRSAVGQTADGDIIFVVIDGRHPGHSIGASMKDVADLMQEYNVVNAMAMDGGTSAMMVHENKILTKSCIDDERGRFLPNAWVVY